MDEIYVKKVPSMKVTGVQMQYLAKRNTRLLELDQVKKVLEQMIGVEDSRTHMNCDDCYRLPVIIIGARIFRINNGRKVKGFVYSSDTNVHWMSVKTLSDWIFKNMNKIGNIV